MRLDRCSSDLPCEIYRMVSDGAVAIWPQRMVKDFRTTRWHLAVKWDNGAIRKVRDIRPCARHSQMLIEEWGSDTNQNIREEEADVKWKMKHDPIPCSR